MSKPVKPSKTPTGSVPQITPHEDADTVIRTVAVVGTGTIGASWAALFLAHGLDVVASDPAEGASDALHAFIEKATPDLRALGATGQGKLTFLDDDVEAAQWADFVQECAPEQDALKADLIGRLDAAAAPDVLIASSTSMIPRSRLIAKARTPSRIIVGHPFNPPHLVPLVEIVGAAPDAPAVRRACALYRSVGRQPVVLRREIFGHIANRLQAAVWREALWLLEHEIADVEDIDRAVRFGPGLRWAIMGPFLTFHLAGGQAGAEHAFEQFGPGLTKLWGALASPNMKDPLRRAMIKGVERMTEGRSIAALEAERDSSLRAILSMCSPANDEPGQA
jgi:carnitine 3-dehydrogenase